MLLKIVEDGSGRIIVLNYQSGSKMPIQNCWVESGQAGLTLEMDSGHKNEKIGFYPKSIRLFLMILCVVDDSHIYTQKELLCARNHLYHK